MRKTSKIEAGDYTRRYGTMSQFLVEQPVNVKARLETADGEDRFIVTTMMTSSEFAVDGDCLNPHPDAPETNVEMVTRLMEWSKNGSLIQPFVLQALQYYAQQILKMPLDQREKMDRSLVLYEPWASCAEEVAEMVGEHLTSR